jgi:hypothetical protein
VNVALVLLGMLAIRQARIKPLWIVLIIAFLGFTVRDVIRQATWGRRAVAEMYWSTSTNGYRGAREYLPADVHLPPKPHVLPEVPLAQVKCEIPCAQDTMKVVGWREEEKLLRVKTAVPAAVTLKLYDYPAWRVEIDGKPATPETTYGGSLKIDVPPGAHELRVWFSRTPDRTAGIVISFFSAMILLALIYLAERREPPNVASN